LLWELRFEPSISYKCFRGNFSFAAKASVLERRSPAGRGDNLLKSGWIIVGYTMTMMIWNESLVWREDERSAS
jgi:hypothetical protein